MPHFECGAFNHSATSPGAKSGAIHPSWSGRVLGEDGWPGKARAEHHTAGIIIAPGMDYMDRAYEDAKREGWSRRPIVEIMIPSTVDDSLAPPGAHVASLFCQQFAPVLPGGRGRGNHERPN